MSYPAGICSYCPAPVIWAWTRHARMPVDPDPAENGTVVLVPRAAGAPQAIVVTGPAAYPGPRYTAHFANCPGADEARKPRTRPPAQSETLF